METVCMRCGAWRQHVFWFAGWFSRMLIGMIGDHWPLPPDQNGSKIGCAHVPRNSMSAHASSDT